MDTNRPTIYWATFNLIRHLSHVVFEILDLAIEVVLICLLLGAISFRDVKVSIKQGDSLEILRSYDSRHLNGVANEHGIIVL